MSAPSDVNSKATSRSEARGAMLERWPSNAKGGGSTPAAPDDNRGTSAPSGTIFALEIKFQEKTFPRLRQTGESFSWNLISSQMQEKCGMLLRSAAVHVHAKRGGCSFCGAAVKPTARASRVPRNSCLSVVQRFGWHRSAHGPRLTQQALGMSSSMPLRNSEGYALTSYCIMYNKRKRARFRAG